MLKTPKYSNTNYEPLQKMKNIKHNYEPFR